MITSGKVLAVKGSGRIPVRASLRLSTDEQVARILDGLDTSCMVDTQEMFVKAITMNPPLFYTGASEDMRAMFSNCYYLRSVPLYDTSSARDMSKMFADAMYGLNYDGTYDKTVRVDVPAFDVGNVTTMESMFEHCHMLRSVAFENTHNVTTMESMFRHCHNLEAVPAMDFSNVTNMADSFSGCSSLASMLCYGMKVSFDVHGTALQHDALVTLLNNLGTPSERQTLTLGSAKLALLSASEKAIATNKNWTLA